MRILGIDIGSSKIKAVEMESAFGRYEIHNYHEIPLNSEVKEEKVISSFIRKLQKIPDRIIVALPSGRSTFRNLKLPTRDKKSIQASVGFELEDELPFPSEECVYDYSTLSQNKQGSFVHVAASLKRHIVTSLLEWQSYGLDPDVVCTDTWAYRTLLNRILGPMGQKDPVFLVQIGREKTTFYLHWQNAPVLVRQIHWGGEDLTSAISQKQGISRDEAESLKIDRGFVNDAAHHAQDNSNLPPEQIELSRCLEGALQPFIFEMRQILLASKSLTHLDITQIYLTGGSSLLPGLGPWIQNYLKIEAQPLHALSLITSSGVTYSNQTEAHFLLATALTLTWVGSERSSCINLRKGDFEKEVRSKEMNFSAIRKPMITASLITICLFVSLMFQSKFYQAKLALTDALLERSVSTFFGSLSSSALKTYMSNTSTLRTSITKELTKQRELSQLYGPNPHSPLNFLNRLSVSIPKDIVVDLVQFQSGTPPGDPFSASDKKNSAQLVFKFAQPQLADKLTDLVNHRLSDLEKSELEEASPGTDGLKKWKITYKGTPLEDSHAQ